MSCTVGTQCKHNYKHTSLQQSKRDHGSSKDVKNRQTQVYAFAEHGTDLGSSKDVKGNPTEFFRRAGHGSFYGVGVKLGVVRAAERCRSQCWHGSLLPEIWREILNAASFR